MIKEILKIFGYKPIFKLEIEFTSNSKEYVNFRYTVNNGLTWNYIYQCNRPFLGFLEYDYTYEKVMYSFGSGKFEGEKEKWNTIDKIKEYESIERDKYIEGNKSLVLERDRVNKRKSESLKNFNK